MLRQGSSVLIERLREAMHLRGMTPNELAEKAKVGKSFVYDILSGKSMNPTTTRLSALSNVLRIPITYLIQDNNENEEYKLFDPLRYVAIKHVNPKYSEPFLFFHKDSIESFISDVNSLVAFSIEGDSMADTLLANDIVLVNTIQRDPYPPGLFLIKDGIGCIVKRVEYSSSNVNRLLVSSDNEKYNSFEYAKDDISILGRVVWYSRKV